MKKSEFMVDFWCENDHNAKGEVFNDQKSDWETDKYNWETFVCFFGNEGSEVNDDWHEVVEESFLNKLEQ